MSGCSSASHGGTYQPMMPTLPCGADVHRGAVALALEELLLQVGVAPVLDDDVDLAGAEALPGDVLLEVLVVDRAARAASWATVPDDVGAGLVADPRVDGHVELAALAAGLARPATRWPRSPRRSRPAATGGERQRGRRGEGRPARAPRLLAVLMHAVSSVASCVCVNSVWSEPGRPDAAAGCWNARRGPGPSSRRRRRPPRVIRSSITPSSTMVMPGGGALAPLLAAGEARARRRSRARRRRPGRR